MIIECNAYLLDANESGISMYADTEEINGEIGMGVYGYRCDAIGREVVLTSEDMGWCKIRFTFLGFSTHFNSTTA